MTIRVGLDASNLRAGGGRTHLIGLLRCARPTAHGISEIVVWGSQSTLDALENRPWLIKRPLPVLERSGVVRAAWQRITLPRLAREQGCDVLFVPGGSFGGGFAPVVTMSRNMLPFEWRELRRYRFSARAARLVALHHAQSRSFRQADGLIFLTEYARRIVMADVGRVNGRVAVIPHGVDGGSARTPKPQRALAEYGPERPFRILYVSIIDVYKHQPEVVEAVAQLRTAGLPVTLELVGPAYPPALRRLDATRRQVDPAGAFVNYAGAVPHRRLPEFYERADLCVFASSCENMPNVLLEGMASGLPIACSSRGPMPEVLGDAGTYFDPEAPDQIAAALRTLVESRDLRERQAIASLERSRQYSWERCAEETMSFLYEIGSTHRSGRPAGDRR